MVTAQDVDGGLDLESVRALFPATRNLTYLDAAAVGIMSRWSVHAMGEIAQSHADYGIVATAAWGEMIEGARRSLAEMIGGSAERLAFTQNTATALALVVNGPTWRDGDNVVVPSGEFPSNFYPWLQLRSKGVHIREVPMVEGHGDLVELDRMIDDRTRVVAISAVQYSSGYRYDLAQIAALCRKRDALLVVDGTQAVGALWVHADRDGVDVLAVSAHKWMLGPLGVGFAHFSERAMDRVQPSVVGWLSVADPYAFTHEPVFASDARRFESGTEVVANIAGLSAAADLVAEIGRAKVEEVVLDRTAELAVALSGVGLTITRDSDRAHWSGILIATSGQGDAILHRRLLAAGVRCSLRNGLRFAPHFYSAAEDFEVACDVLRGGSN